MLPFSELSEEKQARILSEMSREEYDSQHQIYLLSQKMKQSQAGLAPKKELKAQLMAELRPTLSSTRILLRNAALAATLTGLILGYFISQNTDNQIVIQEETKKMKVENKPTTTLLNTPKSKKKSYKKARKARTIDLMQANEADITATFHRNNPNLVWQTEEDEPNENTKNRKTFLQCNE